MDAKRLAEALKSLDNQNFGPNDSTILSTINHPVNAGGKFLDWLAKQVNTAGFNPNQNDDESAFPLSQYHTPEQRAQAAFDVAGMAQVGAFPFAPKSAGGTVGTFIGPKAATWDANKAAAASKLLDEGADPAQVWREHLIGRMPDGKLFSEISDSGVNFAVRPVDEKYNRMPIGRAINHPDAFNAYPENWETKIQFTDGGEGSFGNDLVKVGVDDAPYPISTTLHELQHAIQQREGWARGGSPEGMNDIWTAARARLNFLEKEPDYLEAVKIDDDLFNKAAFGEIPENQYEQASQKLLTDYPAYAEAQKQLKILQQIPQDSTEAYRRLTGEAQARATQDRLNMNMDERRNNYPLAGGKLSDIPLEQLIYRYGDNGPAMSASDNLNESLLQKYLQQGSLTPDELAQYERNAIAMRDSNRQYLNVANADAQGGTAMDRAGAMGFDGDWYHGTNEDFQAFDTSGKAKTSGAGAFLSNNPITAETYAGSIASNPKILPLLVKKENVLEVNAKGRNWNDINTNDLVHKRKKLTNIFDDLSPDDGTSTDEIAGLAPYAGFDGALIKNVKDIGPNSHIFRAKEYLNNKYGIPISDSENYWDTVTGNQFAEARDELEKLYQRQKSDVLAIQKPQNIRSRFAAFDPLRKDSADLLATKLLPATMLGWGMANQKPDNQSLAEALRGGN